MLRNLWNPKLDNKPIFNKWNSSIFRCKNNGVFMSWIKFLKYHFSKDHFSGDLFSGDFFPRGPFFQGTIFTRICFQGTIFRGLFFRDSFYSSFFTGYVHRHLHCCFVRTSFNSKSNRRWIRLKHVFRIRYIPLERSRIWSHRPLGLVSFVICVRYLRNKTLKRRKSVHWEKKTWLSSVRTGVVHVQRQKLKIDITVSSLDMNHSCPDRTH